MTTVLEKHVLNHIGPYSTTPSNYFDCKQGSYEKLEWLLIVVKFRNSVSRLTAEKSIDSGVIQKIRIYPLPIQLIVG